MLLLLPTDPYYHNLNLRFQTKISFTQFTELIAQENGHFFPTQLHSQTLKFAAIKSNAV